MATRIEMLPPGVHPAQVVNGEIQCPPGIFRDALIVRVTVFGIEQNCDETLEIDHADEGSWHWVVYEGDENEATPVPVATIRFIPPRACQPILEGPQMAGSKTWDQSEPFAEIGRLATIKQYRGKGYARNLVLGALKFAGEHRGEVGSEWKGLVFIHAQVGVMEWYAGLGFRVDEGVGRWFEEGIEHVGMWLRV